MPATLERPPAEVPARRPPVSARRIEANRRNARLSTGPRSAAGKRRASRNALRHGARTAETLLPGEDAAAFERHVLTFLSDFAPATDAEAILVCHVAELTWRLERLAA